MGDPTAGSAGDVAMAAVIGLAVGLFIMVSAAFSAWLVLPFFLLPLVLLFAVSVLVGTAAARRLRLPRLAWSRIALIAIVAWPVAAALPYAALVGELYLRIDQPTLPTDATEARIWPEPLSGGTLAGPAPGFVAEYFTPLAPDPAMYELAASLPMRINRHDGKFYAVPNSAQATISADGSGTRVRVGVFGGYTSKLPWLTFLAGWGWIAGVFLVRGRQRYDKNG